MKNVTLSADETLIEEGRAAAREQKTTLNQLFRDWLVDLAERRKRSERTSELMKRVEYANSGGAFTREQMNER